jgi:hypothetical protein
MRHRLTRNGRSETCDRSKPYQVALKGIYQSLVNPITRVEKAYITLEGIDFHPHSALAIPIPPMWCGCSVRPLTGSCMAQPIIAGYITSCSQTPPPNVQDLFVLVYMLYLSYGPRWSRKSYTTWPLRCLLLRLIQLDELIIWGLVRCTFSTKTLHSESHDNPELARLQVFTPFR